MDSTKTDSILQDETFEELLKTICINSTCYKINDIDKSIFDDEKAQKKNEDLIKLEYLKIEDFNSDEIFSIENKYEEIVKNLTNPNSLTRIDNQLSQLNTYDSMKNLNNPNVSTMSQIGNMVERTYNFDSSKKFQMAEEICYLRMIAVKWRPIGGDGNCFYRSVMFSFLENIIIQMDITMLQRIVVEIEEKFDENYKNTKNLPKSIREPITKLNKKLIITILKLIIDELDKNCNKLKALNFLTNSFNFCNSFDTAMILYFRYKLYEFIMENKENYFSEDFPVKIGNLLPFQYEKENGDFLFEKFFHEELLKLYTYAEKLSIYLTPFVLKINLNVIFYDFGKDCNIQTKIFSSYLTNKETLTVLYRKAHYDVAYSKEYLDKHSKFMNHFNNPKDKLLVVNESLIDYYYKNEVCDVDLKQSKIFSKVEKLKKLEMKRNIDDTSTDVSHQSLEDSGITNLENTVKSLEMELKQLQEKNQNIKDNEEIINDKINLPCGCKVNPNNFEEYLNNLFLNYSLDLEKICRCSHNFTIKDLMNLTVEAEQKINNSLCKNKLIESFKNYCMICKKQINYESDKIIKTYKCDELFNEILKVKRIEHCVCQYCDLKKTK